MQSTDLIGYLAALLVAAAFCMKSIVGLRSVAILRNIAFLTYAHLGGLMPVLLLHLVLLPVNLFRLGQILEIGNRLRRGSAGATRPCMAVESPHDYDRP